MLTLQNEDTRVQTLVYTQTLCEMLLMWVFQLFRLWIFTLGKFLLKQSLTIHTVYVLMKVLKSVVHIWSIILKWLRNSDNQLCPWFVFESIVFKSFNSCEFWKIFHLKIATSTIFALSTLLTIPATCRCYHVQHVSFRECVAVISTTISAWGSLRLAPILC